MDILKLHTGGKEEYLDQLKKEKDEELKSIMRNLYLTHDQRQKEIERINLKYKQLQNQGDTSLF